MRVVITEAAELDLIRYQHSVLCETCLPYRAPGEVRLWQRKNGLVRLEVEATSRA